MELFETKLNRKIEFKGKIFTVETGENRLADGTVAKRERVIHNGGAAILPVDKNGEITLVEQYRCGVEQVLLEICAGKTEVGENPKDCAVRELKEELGIVAKNVTDLGTLVPTPAYDSEVIYIYLATELKYVGQKLDEGEFLNIKKLPLKKAVELVLDGSITDSKTQIAILKAERILNGKA